MRITAHREPKVTLEDVSEIQPAPFVPVVLI